jgi:hypothetical protein
MSEQILRALIAEIHDLRARLAALEGSEYIANAGLLDGLHADATGAADAHVVATDASGNAAVVGFTATGLATLSGGFTSGIGKSVSKSVAHNTATAIVDIAIGGAGPICAKYLVTFAGYSANTNVADLWLVGQAYNVATCERIGTLTGLAMTSLTVTAAASTANRKLTLTVTQVNTSSQAQTMRVNVVPLGVVGDATITVTGL